MNFLSTIRILSVLIGILSLCFIGAMSYASVSIPSTDTHITSTTNDFQSIGTAGILTILVLREILDFLRKRDLDKKSSNADTIDVDDFKDIYNIVKEMQLNQQNDANKLRELHDILNTRFVTLTDRNLDTYMKIQQSMDKLVDRFDFLMAQK